jgi:hypothetical protein
MMLSILCFRLDLDRVLTSAPCLVGVVPNGLWTKWQILPPQQRDGG